MYRVAWFVGCPRSGKTTLAIHRAMRWSNERGGIPIVFVDSQEVHQFASLAEYSIKEAIAAVWQKPRARMVRVVPSGADELNAICRAVRKGGDVVLVVDEASYWFSAMSSTTNELLRVMRSTQHSRSEILCTTQHLTGDVSQSALSCLDELYVFRCNSPAVRERLEKDYNLPASTVRELPRGRAIRISTGFEDN